MRVLSKSAAVAGLVAALAACTPTTPPPARICAHVLELVTAHEDGDMLPRPEDRENLLVKCSAELETKREQLGSQGYGELARCAMQAQDIEQLVRCEGASDEAEEPRRSGKLK